MPIRGRTPEECFDTFRRHVAHLISETLTRDSPILYYFENRESPFRTLSFCQIPPGRGKAIPVTIPLETRLGPLHFYLAQTLRAVEREKEYELKTNEYWYRLQETPGRSEKAFLRWEISRKLSSEKPPRCVKHFHLSSTFLIAGRHFGLDEVHLPTGFVLMEEIIRFLISELDVDPPCGDEWPKVLEDSARAFYEDFSPQGPLGS